MRPYVPVTPSPKKSLHNKSQLSRIDKNSAISYVYCVCAHFGCGSIVASPNLPLYLPLSISESDEEDKEITNNVPTPSSAQNVSSSAVRTSRFFSKVSTPVIDVSYFDILSPNIDILTFPYCIWTSWFPLILLWALLRSPKSIVKSKYNLLRTIPLYRCSKEAAGAAEQCICACFYLVTLVRS